jgi:hypothetical protein
MGMKHIEILIKGNRGKTKKLVWIILSDGDRCKSSQSDAATRANTKIFPLDPTESGS